MNALLAQYRSELRMTLRNGEQLLVNVFIPLGVLVFFSNVDVFADAQDDSVQVIAPAVLALAVMSMSLVSLGIGTGFERYYGVLKRLGATPLGRGRWLGAKFMTVLTVEVGQWIALIAVAFALGWDPEPGWMIAIAAGVLGTIAFGGLGLLLAGTLPGLVNLAVCNGLYLVLMLTGDMVFRLEELPTTIIDLSRALPAAPLADIMIAAFSPAHDVHWSSWPVLAGWAVVMPLAAVRWFRWE